MQIRFFRMGYTNGKISHTFERYISELLVSDYYDIDKLFQNKVKVVNPIGLRRYNGTGIIDRRVNSLDFNIYDIFGAVSYADKHNGEFPPFKKAGD